MYNQARHAADLSTRKTSDMQQTFPCPKCGSHNIIGEPACKACGESFKYTCPQCSVVVDTKLKACPKCGATLDWPIHDQAKSPRVGKKTYQEQEGTSEPEIPKQKKRSPILIFGLVIMAATLLAAIAMQVLFQGTPSATAPSPSAPAPETTPDTTEAVEITAEELLQAYRTDEEAAEAEYKGNTLRVTGMVGSIGKNMVGTPFIKLAGGSIEAWRVRCMFDKEYESQLSQVTKGQVITVQGECDDYHKPDVTMKDCILAD